MTSYEAKSTNKNTPYDFKIGHIIDTNGSQE